MHLPESEPRFPICPVRTQDPAHTSTSGHNKNNLTLRCYGLNKWKAKRLNAEQMGLIYKNTSILSPVSANTGCITQRSSIGLKTVLRCVESRTIYTQRMYGQPFVPNSTRCVISYLFTCSSYKEAASCPDTFFN